MRKTVYIIILVLCSQVLFSQQVDKDLNLEKYSKKEFYIDTISETHGIFEVNIIRVKQISNPEIVELWVNFNQNEFYLGTIEPEHGFYLPHPQPLENFYTVVEV